MGRCGPLIVTFTERSTTGSLTESLPWVAHCARGVALPEGSTALPLSLPLPIEKLILLSELLRLSIKLALLRLRRQVWGEPLGGSDD